MDPLSWTGQIAFLTPLLTPVFGLLGLSVLIWIVLNAVLPENRVINSAGGSLSLSAGPRDIASLAVKLCFLAATLLIFSYLVLGLISRHAGRHHWRDGASVPARLDRFDSAVHPVDRFQTAAWPLWQTI